ncbi:urate hydroxylase PuuD [Aeromonas cavernicola]|uniref:Cytochrome c domain-containing protein n=1 Tax=Aeromonas cavernicola TaxID=1006623 RepID=A0A2H9U5B5_9GAMM|nr:urate hydroxylase PuuD [Aeromonas cavernicola]PJG59179.1 hypothetical protein CUC53_08670 [Aeromonas cavernicola]
MDFLIEYAHFLIRWLHVIAAIAWIGESIYFVMLDNSLKPASDAEGKKKGFLGELYAVHGGGFYHYQKYLTNPPKIPADLHWSFWKSYVTWLSGFALFIVVYMLNSSFLLVDPNLSWSWFAKMDGMTANLVVVLFLLAGWLVYDQLCKLISPNMEQDGLLSIAVAVMMIAVAYLSTHMFHARAAFLITGAVMATCMSANVFFWIIPGQRRMVKALKAGEAVDGLDGKRGKQRSLHNTYFTLPVVILMLSNHYSFIYSHEFSWLFMVGFIFAGALIRQYFVSMHAGKNQAPLLVAGCVILLVIGFFAAPQNKSANAVQPSAAATTISADSTNKPPENTLAAATSGNAALGQQDEFNKVVEVIKNRCTACHADQGTIMAAPQKGLVLTNPTNIQLNAERIKKEVNSKNMPLGNVTQMTDDERLLISNWVVQ